MLKGGFNTRILSKMRKEGKEKGGKKKSKQFSGKKIKGEVMYSLSFS